ncbi:major facilitator superfamily domain-containing protein [Microdochium trichocladiopsis]|uniref:Major facilitator superfamily domain-containing protein n=1 Tax=Microdochium trichocladiopsis TaxID=1682393 RepID=A0A9P9BX07_9PEZI|nr:major facilitator superfamily domain-containing protein [Microdochium trichocladiopsis]KAH7041337.1 major facilitator superfamily domain-containing protein [Microdochium trichocladiopsis]
MPDKKHNTTETTVVVVPDGNTRQPRHPQESAAIDKDDVNFDYPEGGLEAWQQVAAGFLAQAMSWGFPTTFGIYQLYYTTTMNLPNAQVSWIGSIQTFCTYALCVVAGRLSDAGYHKTTLLVGSVLAVLGAFMTSLATEFWQILLAQGICQGIGLGLIFMPTIAVMSSYFCQRRALAISIAASGAAVGSIIFPAIVQYLVPQIGFPWASRCATFVMLLLVVVMNAIFRPRAVSPVAETVPMPWIDWSAFTEVPFLLMLVAAFALHMGLFYVASYVNAYAVSILGFDAQQAVVLLLVMNAASGPSRLVFGFVADRWCGPFNGLIFSVVMMSVMIYAWIGVVTSAQIYAYVVFFGTVLGLVMAGFASALAALSTDPAKVGVRFGMTLSLLSFATLAGPPIAGALIDRAAGSYLGAQIYGGTVLILAAAIMVCCRVSITGFRLCAKI